MSCVTDEVVKSSTNTRLMAAEMLAQTLLSREHPFFAGAWNLLPSNLLSAVCMFVDIVQSNCSQQRARHVFSKNTNMQSVRLGRSVSACELKRKNAERCVNMCGMCPSCAFAPKPPGSARCLWKVSDEFKRRFLLELILRCKNTHLLESIKSMLDVTSWTLFTYARSRSPTSPQEHRRTDRALDGKPLGMNMNEIWDWFDDSPDWLKSHYLCRLLSLCDSELLRMVANLASVLLVRQKRGFLQFSVSNQRGQDSDEDSEDPALMVVPGSLKSVSGVSRHRDFIGDLPVDLSKRILGLLDQQTLSCCLKVCRYWQRLAQETIKEVKFRRVFQEQIMEMMKRSKSCNKVSSTYANIAEVPVPVKDDEEVDIHSCTEKVKLFEAAYAKIKTKTVKMEERNVYCGVYFTRVLLNKEDTHRVVDYRGGSLMASGSKDRAVQLLYVASDTKVVSVMKGHVGRIRAVLLCEDRDLVVTASCDSSIRCWNLKTDTCVMALYGHTGAVTCLDVHADRLVSGANDCLVKVWSLHTGERFEEFNFKHPGSVQCVRISMKTIYSSCARGVVKIWDMEKASLIRVLDAHRSSVKCLFFDEWHLLSGDSGGQVMAWSISHETKQCLMTFNHPKEVRSLTLVYLRVITGCVDGKIRIFNFFTGDCLRDIVAEAETGRILSLHFHTNGILVNTTSSVKLLQFAEMFWDYTKITEEGYKSAASLRKLPLMTEEEASHSQKMLNCKTKTPGRAELYHTNFLSADATCRAQEPCVKQSVLLSEKAVSERMRKRGLHHPLTRDSILLRVNAIQRARSRDEVCINMEFNARLRDSWGPQVSQDPLHSDLQALNKQSLHTQIHPQWHTTHDGQTRRAKTCMPRLNRAVSQNLNNMVQGRTQSYSADTRKAIKRVNGFSTSAAEKLQASECLPMRSLHNPESSIKTGTSLPRISPAGSFREQRGFRLLTVTQLDDCVRAKRNLMQN